MADRTDQTPGDINALLDADEDTLFETLGTSVDAAVDHPKVQKYLPPEPMGPAEDLKAFGRSFWRRLSGDAYKLVCGNDAASEPERQKVVDAFALGREAVVAALTTALATSLGLPATITAAVAVIAVRLFFRNAHGAMCEVWQSKITEPSS